MLGSEVVFSFIFYFFEFLFSVRHKKGDKARKTATESISDSKSGGGEWRRDIFSSDRLHSLSHVSSILDVLPSGPSWELTSGNKAAADSDSIAVGGRIWDHQSPYSEPSFTKSLFLNMSCCFQAVFSQWEIAWTSRERQMLPCQS